MKPEKAQIDLIKDAFYKMQTKQDLIRLLNRAKVMLYGEKSIPFQLKQLTYYANPGLKQKRYTKFSVKKKSGSSREINAPVKGLKGIQRALSFVLQCVFEPHIAAMGFVKEKSIVDNAMVHQGARYVYNIDLKDFFSSIDQARVWKCLQLKPFYLNSNESMNLDENFNIPSSGVRSFLTEQNEEIFYKITSNGIQFINDKKGALLKFKHRIIPKSHSNKNDDIKFLSKLGDKLSLTELLKKLEIIAIEEEKNNNILLEEFKKYVPDSEIKIEKNKNNSTRLGLANIIAAICCTEMEVERLDKDGEWIKIKKNVLPQGAPTSPVITNIICQRLDFVLTGVSKRFGLNYTRYADDITFSSMHNVYQVDGDFIRELNRVIVEQGFYINGNKTRLQKDGFRKEVTGLLVNEKVNVQKRYIKELRMWLYYWEGYGFGRASDFFEKQYFLENGHTKKGKPDMINVISGKLDYLKMVKGANNELYLKLKGRFEKLTAKIDPIEQLLDVWEYKSIEDAMSFYYNKLHKNGKDKI